MGRVINIKRQERIRKLKEFVNPGRKVKIRNHSPYLTVGDTLKIRNPSHITGYYGVTSLNNEIIYLEELNIFLRLKFQLKEFLEKINENNI